MDRTNREMHKTGEALAELLRHPQYEVIPHRGVEQSVAEHVPRDIGLTVTASPAKGIWPTVEVAERLSRLGYKVAPHLSARLIENKAQLGEIVYSLGEAGVRDIFVVAGDAKTPVGEFSDAHALLVAVGEIGHPFNEIGIAGYPQGHPIISDEAIVQAMQHKAPYATYIVSQVCFEKDVIVDWVRKVRQRGIDLPLYVGMPGAVSKQKLMRISMTLGLGESTRFLKKHNSWLFRMFMSSDYSPNHLIEGLAPELANPESRMGGFHIYTFNDIDKTEKWRRETLRNARTRSTTPS